MPVDALRVETRIQNEISEVGSVADLVSRFCATHNLSDQMLVALSVSLDETLSNIIKYAYSDQRGHSIFVQLAREPDAVAATVEDDGRPFDPLSAPRLDLKSPDRDSGFGIHFIRNLMDDVKYFREGGLNRLVMRKRIV
ncbi:MAG: ATP-binding protein [Acidobacteriota bacterium]|jgi:anti-sigma regulatory factor (Ser/Thr protein kinase)